MKTTYERFVMILAIIVLISLGIAVMMRDVYGFNSWQSNIPMSIFLVGTFIRIVDIIIIFMKNARFCIKNDNKKEILNCLIYIILVILLVGVLWVELLMFQDIILNLREI